MLLRNRRASLVLAGACIAAFLLIARLPSLVQPAGADQSLYAYVGQRILAGGVPYVDAWDQKPPGIHYVYAILWALWPADAVVAAADLIAALITAILLMVLAARLASGRVGILAAGLFAIWADPSLRRLSGVVARAQCETFIVLFVTAAIVLVATPRRTRLTIAAAGALLGMVVWLKYNAIVYAVPIVAAMFVRATDVTARPSFRSVRSDCAWFVLGTIGVGVLGLLPLAAHGALHDFRLATFDYNLWYSGETYSGWRGLIGYGMAMPFAQARVDLLWFLGGLGLVVAWISTERRLLPLATLWLAAAILSILLNGARNLPQYFIQATPALALAAALGFDAAFKARRTVTRAAVIAVVVAGLARVGAEPPFHHWRLGGLPGLVRNWWFDVGHLRGNVDRETYLNRFGGRDQDKFSALDVQRLADYVRQTTDPDDKILVFGFSPGVYVKSERESASRFFWSLPVILEFAAQDGRYGSAGLLADLANSRPRLIALQKGDWQPPMTESQSFFLGNPKLSAWLRTHYVPAPEQKLFSIWRRRD